MTLSPCGSAITAPQIPAAVPSTMSQRAARAARAKARTRPQSQSQKAMMSGSGTSGSDLAAGSHALRHALEQHEERMDDGRWIGRTAGQENVYGQYPIQPIAAGIPATIRAAGDRAGAGRYDESRLRHTLIRLLERAVHGVCHGSRDQQQVREPR